MARAARISVPKILSFREHLNGSYNCFFSILIINLSSIQLENLADPLLVESEDLWLLELKNCVTAICE